MFEEQKRRNNIYRYRILAKKKTTLQNIENGEKVKSRREQGGP